MSDYTITIHIDDSASPEQTNKVRSKIETALSTIGSVTGMQKGISDTQERTRMAAKVHKQAYHAERAMMLLPPHGHTENAIEGKSIRLHAFYAGILQGLDLSYADYFMPLWGDLYLQYLSEIYPALADEVYGQKDGGHPLSNPFDRGIYEPFVNWAEKHGFELPILRAACEEVYNREHEEYATLSARTLEKQNSHIITRSYSHMHMKPKGA